MSFDGVFTHVIVAELKKQLKGGRINKVQQPYENEMILVIRSQGTTKKLLLSAHSSYARIQLTEIQYQNPATPPNFCMMLRKYLEGAILEEITQVDNDRVIHFTFSKRNELGDLENILLIAELMGRHSTIVLVNQATGKILDCIKHIGPSQNTYRTLLPGADYVAPPKQTAKNPWQLSDATIFDLLHQLEVINGPSLQSLFQGLGRDTADELAFRLGEAVNDKMKVWHHFWQSLNENYQPVMAEKNGKSYFTPLPFLTIPDGQTFFSSCSQLLDAFYEGRAERERVKQQGSEMLKKIQNELQKNIAKQTKLEETLIASDNAEILRQKGELLTTFMSQVPRGANEVILENYYEENAPIKIQLRPDLSPNQNAQKYFQKYQKLKNAVSIVENQLTQCKEEIRYLESVESQLEIATPLDLDVIREELIAQNYLKVHGKNTAKKARPSQPEIFTATDGTSIYVGKNNLQNDQLTLRKAKKTDYWLHAKDIPGSHVIIADSDPSEETLLEAAMLAAFYSKYRLSAQVPVDYVQVKHIRKPNGAKPGYVIYEGQRTLYVTPDKEKVAALKAKDKAE